MDQFAQRLDKTFKKFIRKHSSSIPGAPSTGHEEEDHEKPGEEKDEESAGSAHTEEDGDNKESQLELKD